MKAKKHLGQHFLTSKAVLRDMIEAAAIQECDTVLEIGPGKGVLTRALLETGAHVIAVETDADMISVLEEYFNDFLESKQLILIHEDILNISIKTYVQSPYKLVANIPYYITGEIIRRFLSEDAPPISMTLLVQKEVAYRIARDTKESILSISVKVFGVPRYVTTVPARYFSPAPKVDSAVLHISDISKSFFTDISEKHFFNIVKNGFSSKRKMLLNNLSSFASKETLLQVFMSLDLSEKIRAEEVKLAEWKELAKKLH